jgi:undecaprenyl-diphosphatase
MSLTDINIHLFRIINDLGKEYTALNPVMVFIADYMIYFLAVAIVFFCLSRNKVNRIMVLCAGLSVVAAEIIGKLAGIFYSNYQPFAELTTVNQLIEKAVDNSFPSDHTIIFFSVCVTFWLFQRGWGLIWIGLAALVGYSRIWVGVHYPGDVLAAIIISSLMANLMYRVVPKLRITQTILKKVEKVEEFVRSHLKKKSNSRDM